MDVSNKSVGAGLADATLAIIDDDNAFAARLSQSMEQRGFSVKRADSVQSGLELIEQSAPAFAVIDLRLGDGSGLDLVDALLKRRPNARSLILTGYGNFATAVSAVKLGAADYIAKPADADEIVDALLAPKGKLPSPPEHPLSANRATWEHIMRVFEDNHNNVSETSRRLSMHRRTLQRILRKHAPH